MPFTRQISTEKLNREGHQGREGKLYRQGREGREGILFKNPKLYRKGRKGREGFSSNTQIRNVFGMNGDGRRAYG
jgi:hypothetical protein